jgi:hypothetical protein
LVIRHWSFFGHSSLGIGLCFEALMDCRTARQLLPFARRGAAELERADLEVLERHLADCSECSLQAEAERAADGVFAQAMRAVPIPAGLQQRLVLKLTHARRRFYLRWGVRCGAAAAALLVAFLFYYRAYPEQIDELVYSGAREQLNFPGPLAEPAPPPPSVGPFRSTKDMLEHLRALGSSVELPPDIADNWDFRFLRFATVENYQGKPTAVLGFQKGNAKAKVWLLGPGQIDPVALDAIRAAGNPQRKVIGDERKECFIAIVELSEEARMEDFLRPKQTVA